MNNDAVLKLLAFGEKIFSNESNSESDEETLGFKFQRIQQEKIGLLFLSRRSLSIDCISSG